MDVRGFLIPNPYGGRAQVTCIQEEFDECSAETKRLSKIAAPLAAANLFLYSILAISLMFVGHLGELHLSGAALATSFASITGFSLVTAMAGALDTFCGQSYAREQYQMLGIYMQRAMFTLLLVGIPLACFSASLGHILEFFGQDPEISTEAGEYALYLIPNIFGVALLQCQIRFLEAQKSVLSVVVSAGMTALLHGLTCWLLVIKYGLGSRGAALATSISSWFHVLFLALYIKLSPSCKDTWTGFSWEAFHGLPSFLRLAVPRARVACLEIWPFELMVLASAFLPNPRVEISAMSICVDAFSMASTFPLALGIAVSIRVSNELQAQRRHNARTAASTAHVMHIFSSYLVSMTSVFCGKHWANNYGTDEEVVNHAAVMLTIIAMPHFVRGLKSIFSGTAVGSGHWNHGPITNMGTNNLLGIPAGIFFAFACHAGGPGLWMGITLVLFLGALFLGVINWQLDWLRQGRAIVS